MKRSLSVTEERFALAAAFTISRGSKTEAAVLTCMIEQNGNVGRGECVPYARYGETPESVRNEIEETASDIANSMSRQDLLSAMKPGAARNAIDCALWDLEAKISGVRAYTHLGAIPPRPLETAYTIPLGEPAAMAAQARQHSGRPLLKVKVGTSDDTSRIEAVTRAAPQSRIILDANEGWTEENLAHHLDIAAQCGVALIEQPLPAGQDEALRMAKRSVPVCADESVHVAGDIGRLVGLYDAINIKLDKTGGLTAALELRQHARQLDFSIMVGCMVATSLAMAPAVLLAQDADFIDLDGPLLLAQDRKIALTYSGSLVYPPEAQLWG